MHSVQNTSCVLDVSGTNVLVSTRTGANSQIWTLENTVTYNANGGTGAPAIQTKTYGTRLTLNSVKPTRSGYTFLGWATASAATSATYSSGSRVWI